MRLLCVLVRANAFVQPMQQGVVLDSLDSLQNFLARLPIGYNVVILSPHGFFGQANVLGKPDTGGQVGAQKPRCPRPSCPAWHLLCMPLKCTLEH